MELSEFFKEHSIEDISKKTNIPKEKLESLREKKWEDFRKPQVIGFLNIIQREYKIDLSDAISEAKEYFQEHQLEKAVASIDMIDSTVLNEDKGYLLTKLIYLLTIIALAYAGWYYYNKEVEPERKVQESNSSIVSDTISSVKNLLGVDSKEVIAKSTLKESKEEQNSSEVAVAGENNKSSMLVSQNGSFKEERKDFSKEPPKEDKKAKFDITTFENKELVQEQNSTQEENIEDTNSIKKAVETLLEENDSIKQAHEQNKTQEALATKSNASELNSSLEENTTAAMDKIDTVAELNKSNQAELLKEKNETLENNQTTPTVELAKIVSTAKKLWIGIYNLNSKKRETKILTRKTPLELVLSKGDYAVVTGHNKFEVEIGEEKKSFPKKGKVYFLLSKKEGFKKLTKAEYRKVTKRRAW